MKKLLITSVLGLFLCNFAWAKNEYKPIIISGTISTEFINFVKLPEEIRYYNTYQSRQPWEGRQIYKVSVKNNNFKIKIYPSSAVGYFELWWLQMFSLQSNQFVIEAGDSVHIDYKNPKDVIFTGKGSSKLNFQHTMGMEIHKFQKIGDVNDPSRIVTNQKRKVEKSNLVMSSLNQYKKEWKNDTFELIKLNAFSAINDYYLTAIEPLPGIELDSAYRQAFTNEVRRLFVEQNGFAVPFSFSLRKSHIYHEYMLHLNELYQMVSNQSGSQSPFEFIFSTIRQNYDGLLQDELLKNHFLKHINKNKYSTDLLVKAIESVQNPDCKERLKAILSSRDVGTPVYDFSFEDINGRSISLNMLKGKVIVIDTWFYGCGNCILLTKKMEPIVKYFEGKGVVFLSVNVDADRKKFQAGVNSGKYGSEKSLYTYTNGMGQNHPMLKYYNYISYPNLLIVAKDGKLISGNPPRPVSESTSKAFIDIIEQNL
ncbi:TlpA family protein disulfide reductase [Pedobacter sp. G11]|uniref:TlpA family protein disulfide reductase n=1 Tax=Pedobacter sp. G11 TaxID=2482728 RepID=UPI000F5F7F65|nr:TlpA disulfide reductase family protein [Pedobacter sp. G11]AZI24148.1 TlpA family protein disulfide reductase [Pedobacter sp. G11]